MTSGIDFWVAGTVADAERERGLLSLFVSFTQTGHKYQDLASLDTYALFYVLTAQKEGMGISINLPPCLTYRRTDCKTYVRIRTATR